MFAPEGPVAFERAGRRTLMQRAPDGAVVFVRILADTEILETFGDPVENEGIWQAALQQAPTPEAQRVLLDAYDQAMAALGHERPESAKRHTLQKVVLPGLPVRLRPILNDIMERSRTGSKSLPDLLRAALERMEHLRLVDVESIVTEVFQKPLRTTDDAVTPP